jgi:NitT/TauT family transport system substrate-binding protein
LEARSQAGIPLVDVATIFQKYPVVLVVPTTSPIHTAADLRGHTIGVPGPYGATYTGLLALLHSAGLSTSDVDIKSIGFTQVAALLTHQVDAVVGYANNEPIQLAAHGFAVRTINVWDVQPLVSNGLVVLSGELKQHPDVVRAIVEATLRGVRETMANPQEAVRISASYVPGLDQPAKLASALAELQATIPMWQGASKLGYNDPATWQAMASFLGSAGLVHGTINPAPAFTNAYLPD